jgi:hypothetical protein
LLASCGPALADEPAGVPPDAAVVITAAGNPVRKSYRKMVEAAELFERRHDLAPAAALRFRLLLLERDTPMEGIESYGG